MKRKKIFRVGSSLPVICLATVLCGCWSSHKVETSHRVEPIEINININVKIQNELAEKFKAQDEAAAKISDAEAEAALQRFLEENK
jgi:hypothetical protein